MTCRAVFFDLDGTLVDSLDDLTAAVNHMLSRFGKPTLNRNEVRKLVGKGARNLVQRALDTRSIHEIDQGLELFVQYNSAHIVNASRLYPGVREMLEQLAARKTLQAVISNKTEALSRQILKSLAVDRFFDVIAGGDTFEEMKPSPLPLLRVMESFHIPASGAIMVGDSINDIQAGNSAGITTIGCNWGYGDSSELAEATLRVSTVAELSTLLTLDEVA